jgi:hypothetical protein
MTKTMQEAIEAFKTAYARGLARRPEDIMDVDEADGMIHEGRIEMGQAAMALGIDAAVTHALLHPPECCGHPMQNHHRPELSVQSMQSKHEAKGVSFRCNTCGRTVRPVHDCLGIGVFTKTTALFDRLSADFFLDKGAPTAVNRLKEHHGVEPGRTTVLNRVEQRSRAARQFLDNKLKQASTKADKQRGHPTSLKAVFAQMDSSSGKTVQPLVRQEPADGATVERTPVRNLPKVKRPIEGRQVKLLCTQAQGAVSWVYDAYIGEFDDAPRRLEGLAATRGWQPGVLAVMTADGEDKNRECGEGAFLPDFKFVLDHQHALGHLKDVVTYGKSAVPTAHEQWMDGAIRRLHAGKVYDVISEVHGIAEKVAGAEDKNKVDNVATYFKERADAVHYDQFKDNGWPIASGAVEGGHINFIHPISKRGSGWLTSHLSDAVALACIRQSGWWDEFWQSASNCDAIPRRGSRAAV